MSCLLFPSTQHFLLAPNLGMCTEKRIVRTLPCFSCHLTCQQTKVIWNVMKVLFLLITPRYGQSYNTCILSQIICLFVISPRGLSFCLSSPSPHQPFSLWACVCLHFHFLVWHLVSEWLLRMADSVDFQFTGSDLSSCSWEMCKVYGILANQMYLCRPIIQ